MAQLDITSNILNPVLWCLLPTLLLFNTAQAQSYTADVSKLSVEDGLSNRFVTSIHQDSQGFMWLGTRYGLNRYDGYEFKHYTKENSALTSNDIMSIHEDTQQQLWIVQTQEQHKTIDIMDPNNDRIQNFDSVFKTQAPFKAKEVRYVYADTEKTLWITTDSGKLYRYKGKRFEYIFTIASEVNIFYADKNFLWWLYPKLPQQSSLLKGLRINTKTTRTFTLSHKLKLVPAGADDQGNLWLFQPEEKKFLKTDWERQLIKPATMPPPELPEFASSITFTEKRYLNPPGDFIWWLSGSENFHLGFPMAWNLKENTDYDFR
ncbi:MAG: two-component regulator propeller domain-containing protein [Bacteroidota bacterium]